MGSGVGSGGSEGKSSPVEEGGAKIVAQLRTMQQIISRFNSLKVDSTEYTCLKAITLFKAGQIISNLHKLLSPRFYTAEASICFENWGCHGHSNFPLIL